MTPAHKIADKKRFYCNTCRTATNHSLKGRHPKRAYSGEYGENYEEEVFSLWVCDGCETGTLEKAETADYLLDENGDQVYVNFAFFPKRSERNVDGKRFKKLPGKLDRIYRETLMAFNDDLDILCAAGLRALMEGICADKGIGGRTLKKRIDNLIGVLPPNIVSSLHGFRFIGNTALHQLTPPAKDELRLAIEVSEDLLNFLYELDYKASRLLPPPQRKPLSKARAK